MNLLASQAELEPVRRARPLLGTVLEISVLGADRAVAHAKLNEAFDEATRLERLLSYFNPVSDVSRLNREGIRRNFHGKRYQSLIEASSAMELAPETREVLAFADELWEYTAGRFDVECAGVLRNCGYLANAGDIEGVIDLGGVAKGFIVDRVFDHLNNSGFSRIVVNAGGDMRFSFESEQPIAIRSAEECSKYEHVLMLKSGAIATSAGYYSAHNLIDRSGESKQVNPLVDTRISECVRLHSSISVIADHCMYADGLTKVVALYLRDATDRTLADGESALVLARYGARAFVQLL